MIAVPINSLGENPSLSNYFGKSKWFAFFDEGTISFEKNTFKNGCSTVDWLYDLGVTKTIVSHIGRSPLYKLHDMDIECLFSREDVRTLTEVLSLCKEERLILANKENEIEIIDTVNGCKEIC